MNTKELWLSAPEGDLADSIKDIIRERWDDEPTAIQILEVIDHCIHWGAASDFSVKVLDIILRSAIKKEGTSLSILVDRATWRD